MRVSPAHVILHGVVDDEIARAVDAQIHAGVGIPGHIILFDEVFGAICEHVKAVHISLQHVFSNGIVTTGWKEINAISAIAVGHIIRDEVVVGIGEVYSVPAFPDYAVKAGIVSSDCVPVGKEQGNAGLSTVDYGVVGNYAALHIVELYSVKTVSD
jgi:hypothetical protein